jgi:flagellar biosynthesis chaperone FliJ
MTAQLPKPVTKPRSPAPVDAAVDKGPKADLKGKSHAEATAALAPEKMAAPTGDGSLGSVLNPGPGAAKPEAKAASSKAAEDRKAAQIARGGEVRAARAAAREAKKPNAHQKAIEDKAAEHESKKGERQAAWEEEVKTEAKYHQKYREVLAAPDCAEAIKYHGDAKIQQAKSDVESTLARRSWDAYPKQIEGLKKEVQALAPHIKFFKELEEKRLPWVREKLGPEQSKKSLAKVEARLNTRFAGGRDELEKLRNWLDTNYMGSVERPETEAEFAAVAGKEDDAKQKLDELLARGVIRSGGLAQKYRTSYDGHSEYSVEYTIQGVPQIVLHCHCTSAGVPKPGNASHWKRKSQKRTAGTSHPVSQSFVNAIVDVAQNKAAPLT